MEGTDDGTFIRASILCGFAEFVTSRGGDPVGMAERVGIDPDALSAPDMIVSFRSYGALLERAAAELDLPTFGLALALDAPAHFPGWGPVLLLAATTATFGEWIERVAALWRLHTNGLSASLIDDGAGNDVTIRFDARGTRTARRQKMEHILASTKRLAQAVRADFTDGLVAIRFRHDRPRFVAVHEAVFRCRLEFGAPHDEIVFSRAMLDKPLDSRGQALEATMDQFLRDRIGSMSRYRPGVSTSTALAIRTVLGAGLCSKEFIAHALGSSPRRLQRLLAHEGTTYEEVLDAVHREAACRLLADTTVPIGTVGRMLDFASAAALTLAVRRWTGMTPSAYRLHARNAPPPAPFEAAPVTESACGG